MLAQNQDFVIINVNDKNVLAKVIKCKNQTATVLLNGKHLADKTEAAGSEVRISLEEILANFGPSPNTTTAFGVKIEPWLDCVKLKRWGNLHIFRKVDDRELNEIISAFNKVGKTLSSYGTDYKLPIDLELRPGKGKYAGMYYVRGDKSDLMVLSPKEIVQTEYIVYHETGHHIEFRYMNKEIKKKWMDLYQESIAVKEITVEKLRKLRKQLVSIKNISTFKKELDEDDVKVFRLILRHIKEVYKIDSRDLQMMLEEDDNLVKVWPKITMEMSNTELVVSEYAKKSCSEFFAESFAFYHTNQHLPKNVRRLMKHTIQVLKSENLAKSVKPKRNLKRQHKGN